MNGWLAFVCLWPFTHSPITFDLQSPQNHHVLSLVSNTLGGGKYYDISVTWSLILVFFSTVMFILSWLTEWLSSLVCTFFVCMSPPAIARARGIMFSGYVHSSGPFLWRWYLKNALRNFLQILHKCQLWLKDKLISGTLSEDDIYLKNAVREFCHIWQKCL